MTANKLIQRALRILGVLHQGGNPSGTETADALEALNEMLATWSTQGLTIYEKKRETFSLVASQSQYSIGSSGDFDTVWPLEIFNAGVIQVGDDSEIPIRIINQDEWARIVDKNTQSTLPLMIYYNRAYPLGEIHCWPVPSAAPTLVLYSLKQLSSFALATTNVDFPPGYNEAIAFNLADRLAPEYDVELKPQAKKRADEAFAMIQRANFRPITMQNDAVPLVGAKNYGFDYRTGD